MERNEKCKSKEEVVQTATVAEECLVELLHTVNLSGELITELADIIMIEEMPTLEPIELSVSSTLFENLQKLTNELITHNGTLASVTSRLNNTLGSAKLLRNACKNE